VYAKPQGKPLVDHYVTDIEQDTWIQLPWDMELAYSAPLAEQKS
jgi:xanthine phosphoribosyltransferase